MKDEHHDWDDLARNYDEIQQGLTLPDTEALLSLIAGDKILELGCGTGVVSLALAQKGLSVTGIDYSTEMLKEFTRKIAAFTDIDITLKHVRMEEYSEKEVYDTVICVNSTLWCLLSPDEQLLLLKNQYQNLKPGGCLIIHTTCPKVLLERWGLGRNTRPAFLDTTSALIMSASIILDTQQLEIFYDLRRKNGQNFWWSTRLRFVWYNELILMAKISGFDLQSSYGTWKLTSYGSGREMILKFKKPNVSS